MDLRIIQKLQQKSMIHQKNRFIFIFFIITFLSKLYCTTVINIDSSKLPLIQNPNERDSLFLQFKEDADYNNKILHNNKEFYKDENKTNVIISFYKVLVPAKFDFLWLKSRFTPISAETISTLNNITTADSTIANKVLIIPTFSGLFIPEKPTSTWELLLHKKYLTSQNKKETLQVKIDNKLYYFFYNEKFDLTTYTFFLDTTMKIPLKNSILSSNYGYRVSPISGKWKFHSGIDLAAPEGSDVFACKSGEVIYTGFNSIYGNYIIINHFNNMTSIYAHLSKILVKKEEKINSGHLIGKVGSTGASTGPHLHFEIRQNGNTKNPEELISIK